MLVTPQFSIPDVKGFILLFRFFQDAFDADDTSQSAMFTPCDPDISPSSVPNNGLELDNTLSMTLTSGTNVVDSSGYAVSDLESHYSSTRIPFSSTSTQRNSSGSTYQQEPGSEPLTPGTPDPFQESSHANTANADPNCESTGPSFPTDASMQSSRMNSETFHIVSRSDIGEVRKWKG